ncbi:MAG TPA: hypothetical protein VHQ00_05125 [Chloroflexota bacterium]|jgi:hypothetical protein|nr:hypothetical protein [Chloroflexota bacterium]
MSTTSVAKHRPFGVILLAILAGVSALGALWHTLQYLGIVPVTLGRLQFYGVDLLGAVLWGLTAAVWIWAVVNLWNLNPQALLFVTLLAGWQLILAVLSIFGASDFQAVLPTILIAGAILLYALSPGVRRNFGMV